MEGKTNFSRRLKQFGGLTWWPRPFLFYDRSTPLLWLMWRNSTVTWERSFSHMKRVKSVLHSSMAQERIKTWPFWTLSKTLSTKWIYRRYWFIHSCKNQEKACFKCFVLRTCNTGFRSHLFHWTKYSFAVSSIWKILLFQFLRLLYFQMSYMNTKLRFQIGPRPLIAPVRQGTWS